MRAGQAKACGTGPVRPAARRAAQSRVRPLGLTAGGLMADLHRYGEYSGTPSFLISAAGGQAARGWGGARGALQQPTPARARALHAPAGATSVSQPAARIAAGKELAADDAVRRAARNPDACESA